MTSAHYLTLFALQPPWQTVSFTSAWLRQAGAELERLSLSGPSHCSPLLCLKLWHWSVYKNLRNSHLHPHTTHVEGTVINTQAGGKYITTVPAVSTKKVKEGGGKEHMWSRVYTCPKWEIASAFSEELWVYLETCYHTVPLSGNMLTLQYLIVFSCWKKMEMR